LGLEVYASIFFICGNLFLLNYSLKKYHFTVLHANFYGFGLFCNSIIVDFDTKKAQTSKAGGAAVPVGAI
jgi:hypothetical protein